MASKLKSRPPRANTNHPGLRNYLDALADWLEDNVSQGGGIREIFVGEDLEMIDDGDGVVTINFRPLPKELYRPPYDPTPGAPDKTTKHRQLSVAPGVVFAPVADVSGDEEIPEQHLGDGVMSQIALVDLDDENPNTLLLTSGSENYIYHQLTLVRRETRIGTSQLPGVGDPPATATNIGLRVLVESTRLLVDETTVGGGTSPDPHDHSMHVNQDSNSPTDDGAVSEFHQHYALVEVNMYTYHLSTATPPQIKVSTQGFPPDWVTPAPTPDTELVHNIPMGRYSLDPEGVIVKGSETYWRPKENLYYYPPQYLSSISDPLDNPT